MEIRVNGEQRRRKEVSLWVEEDDEAGDCSLLVWRNQWLVERREDGGNLGRESWGKRKFREALKPCCMGACGGRDGA
ncbi:hypothetical protein KI387_012503, partial [Taxus chinensis]